jgi:hypothetical protein
MTLIPTWLTSKRAGPAAAGLAAVLLLFGITQTVGRISAEHRVAKLEALIDSPHTGWKSRIAACEVDVRSLNALLASQNAAMADVKADGEAAAKALAAAHHGRSGVVVDRLLQPAIGGDACIRLMDIDRRVTETLK